MNEYPLYINGEFITTQSQKDIINPSNSQVIAKVSCVDEKNIEDALCAAKAAVSGEWAKISLADRKEYILKISKGILDRASELAKIECQNSGKPIKETTFMDIPSSAETFHYFANNLEKFLESKIINIDSQIAQAESNLVREPRGVVVLIVPWNYPLLIACWKMAQALAAGNTVIIKPASLTPLSLFELGKIIHQSGLPKGVVNIIYGDANLIGEKLCRDRRVDMISFTGSNLVGQKILEYSSQNVKKTIMELGGKSASIVLGDADLEAAVNGSLCSIFLNQGQMCTAMSRILVDASIYDKFVNDFVAKAKRIKIGDASDFQTQIGPLISKKQRELVLDFIKQAKESGASLLCGGKISDDINLKDGFFFEPTVLADVDPKSKIFQKEVFGPVVCINKFSTIEEAINLANDSDFGLAGCIWSQDLDKAKEIAAKIDTGTIWINTYGMFFNETPFGGFKQSGFGKELGQEGFLEYTRLKNIISDKTKDSKPLVNYWYGF